MKSLLRPDNFGGPLSLARNMNCESYQQSKNQVEAYILQRKPVRRRMADVKTILDTGAYASTLTTSLFRYGSEIMYFQVKEQVPMAVPCGDQRDCDLNILISY